MSLSENTKELELTHYRHLRVLGVVCEKSPSTPTLGSLSHHRPDGFQNTWKRGKWMRILERQKAPCRVLLVVLILAVLGSGCGGSPAPQAV
jgi:hypothetical protein